MKINIYNPDYYEFDKPELVEQTKSRLTEISECEMTEVGEAEFGYINVMSGLYIERVWNFTNTEFRDYMDWAKSLIDVYLKNKV
jgi:hypothetical protein